MACHGVIHLPQAERLCALDKRRKQPLRVGHHPTCATPPLPLVLMVKSGAFSRRARTSHPFTTPSASSEWVTTRCSLNGSHAMP